ncbi:MAG TPA: hypothetical protein VF183_14725, partial [Acidimicrobiales bacterium]
TLPPAPTPTQPQTPGPQPSTSQPPPTQSSTTTTQPPDQTPPVLGNPTANPADIREDGDLGSTTCTPRTSQITVTASDPQSGISEVVMHWAVRDAHKVVVASGSTPMVLQSGAYRATLGPFHNDTLPALSANATVEVTLVATNGAGLSATTGTTVTLRDCSFG